MGVVKNLLVRIGADMSGMKREMDKASRELKNFSQKTNRSLKDVNGKKGIGGFNDLTKSLSKVSGNATKSLGELAIGMEGLTAATVGLSAVLGPAGVVIGGLTVAIIAATAAIGAASQPAVKFESDLKRVNIALGESTTQYMGWAKSMGLSKTTAAQLGGTYGILLSSFVDGNKELGKSTEQIVQATRVVASATGRTLDDTFERIRSGLLGNTEAIEDLGIYVNVSMIESTKAFQKFANGKHWDQLDYRVQQQIRLQAILEQAQARYGSSLQDSVMTKQQQLVEQLKDVKLNLSQAFLPIWEKILPALSDLANALVIVTEKIARFSYWLAGKDYEEATKGTNEQSKAVTNLGDSYQAAADQAKNALASFDEIHQLGDFSVGNSGSSGGTGGGSGSNNGGMITDGNGPQLPGLPPLPKLQLKFDLPDPPDAGIGGVATAVTSTMNEMVKQVQTTTQGMWSNLALQTTNGRLAQETEWSNLSGNIGGIIVPAFSIGIVGSWANMLNQLQAMTAEDLANIQINWNAFDTSVLLNTVSTNQAISVSWHNTLDYMLKQLVAYNPVYIIQWMLLQNTVQATTVPLANVKKSWQETLEDMKSKLRFNLPEYIAGWSLIGISVSSLNPILNSTETAWKTALSNMYQTVKEKARSIIDQVNAVITAWARMQSMISGQQVKPNTVSYPGATSYHKPSPTPAYSAPPPAPATTPKTAVEQSRELPVIGDLLKTADWVRDNISKPLGDLLGPYIVPGASFTGVGSAVGAGALQVGSKIDDLLNLLKNAGITVPQFATGGITNGPMMAMIGDNPGGREVISPLGDLMDMIQSAVGTAILTASQMQGNKQGDINLVVDGTTFARITNAYYTKETTRIGGSMITAT